MKCKFTVTVFSPLLVARAGGNYLLFEIKKKKYSCAVFFRGRYVVGINNEEYREKLVNVVKRGKRATGLFVMASGGNTST